MKTPIKTPALWAVLHFTISQCLAMQVVQRKDPTDGSHNRYGSSGDNTGNSIGPIIVYDITTSPPRLSGHYITATSNECPSGNNAGPINVQLDNITSQTITECPNSTVAGAVTVVLNNLTTTSITVCPNVRRASSITVRLNNITTSTINVCPNIFTSGPITVYSDNVTTSTIIVAGRRV